jgi:hypothetical protein
MPNLKIVNHLKQASEQDRIKFFFGAIVAKTWSVITLEEVLSRGIQESTLEMLLARVSEVSALNNSLSSMLSFSGFNSVSPNVQAKVQQYKALPINERINRADEFEAAVLQIDNRLYNSNPISQIRSKDFNFFANIQSLINTYAAKIYEESETADALLLLKSYLDKICQNVPITTQETQPLLRIFMILSSALIDATQKQEFILLFKISLNMEYELFAGLNKTRKFLLNIHADVNRSQWNNIKSKTTFFGDGKTPGGVADIRRGLSDIHKKALNNTDVYTLFSPVYTLLKEKADQRKKPMKRTDTSNDFYMTKYREAAALNAVEVQAYTTVAQRNRRPSP